MSNDDDYFTKEMYPDFDSQQNNLVPQITVFFADQKDFSSFCNFFLLKCQQHIDGSCTIRTQKTVTRSGGNGLWFTWNESLCEAGPPLFPLLTEPV